MQIQSDSYCVPSRAFDRWDADNEEDEREERREQAARDNLATAIHTARRRCGPVWNWDSRACVHVAAARQYFHYLSRHKFTDPTEI